MERKKNHIIIEVDAKKRLGKNPALIHVRSLGEIRDTRCIPKHNTDHI